MTSRDSSADVCVCVCITIHFKENIHIFADTGTSTSRYPAYLNSEELLYNIIEIAITASYRQPFHDRANLHLASGTSSRLIKSLVN